MSHPLLSGCGVPKNEAGARSMKVRLAIQGEMHDAMKTRCSQRLARLLKRGLDILISALVLVLLAPLMAGIALAVGIKLGRPILFRQERPGLGGRPFILHKFRTMRDATDVTGRLLPDAERMTPLGRVLRATSLDELPEFWHVLIGAMSLVGPRPLLMRYLPRYTPEQYRRHAVRPGLTGLAQVKGRNAITWEERLAWDVYYVDHWSLRLDLAILGRTLWAVVRREGVSPAGQVTMSEFMGSSKENKS
jgi:sugar transferase EpsL